MADKASYASLNGQSVSARKQCCICWNRYNPGTRPQRQTLQAQAEAEAIGDRDPLSEAGLRAVERIPWRRRGDKIAMTSNFASGKLCVDTRRFQLIPQCESPFIHGAASA